MLTGTPPTSYGKIVRGTPCTPTLYDAGEESLLRVIRDIWPKAVDNSSKMTIEASQNLGSRHPGFELFKNFGQ
jgi:hypothetical protein